MNRNKRLEKEVEKLKSEMIAIEKGYEESNQTLESTFNKLEKAEGSLVDGGLSTEVADLKEQNLELTKSNKALEHKLSECNFRLAKDQE